MIRYYKLFDLLNRRGMKKSDLRKILSGKTVAKLSKGENITTEVINQICIFLHCQPSDIMECIIEEQINNEIVTRVPQLNGKDYISYRPVGEPPVNDYRLGTEYIKRMDEE